MNDDNATGAGGWGVVLLLGLALGGASLYVPFGQEEKPPPLSAEQQEVAERLRQIDLLKAAAVRLAADGKDDEAIVEFLRLNYVNPNDPFSYRRMGAQASRLGIDRFGALLKTALKGRPDEAEFDRIYGGALHYAKEEQAAAEAIRRFRQTYPDNLAGRFYYGAILRALGETEAARELMLGVITEAPTHHYAYLELQQIYDTLGNDTEAERMFGLALKTDPTTQKGICCGLPKTSS